MNRGAKVALMTVAVITISSIVLSEGSGLLSSPTKNERIVDIKNTSLGYDRETKVVYMRFGNTYGSTYTPYLSENILHCKYDTNTGTIYEVERLDGKLVEYREPIQTNSKTDSKDIVDNLVE